MIDLGLLHHFLGMSIFQDHHSIIISQEKYAQNLISKFNMSDCKPSITPIETIGVASRFMQEPYVQHWKMAKCILIYIKGTINFGLYYTHTKNAHIYGYCDADFAGDSID